MHFKCYLMTLFEFRIIYKEEIFFTILKIKLKLFPKNKKSLKVKEKEKMYHYGGYGYPSFGNAFATDWNGDGLITSADFRIGAYHMGLGPIGAGIAQSAFHAFDRNHNGYLDYQDVYGHYGYRY